MVFVVKEFCAREAEVLFLESAGVGGYQGFVPAAGAVGLTNLKGDTHGMGTDASTG
jgi:hypothetical protein